MAVLAAIGLLEAELALEAQATIVVARHAQAHLVHALVQPLHAGVPAGAPSVLDRALRRGTSVEPENDSSHQHREYDQGKAHAHSVGLAGGRLKARRAGFFSPPVPLRYVGRRRGGRPSREGG